VLESLRQMGVDELEVTYQQLTGTNAVRALIQGEVDAVHCWGREKRRALNAGYQVVGRSNASSGLVAQVLLVATEVIETRDESVEALILGLLMAVDTLVASPEKSLAGIASTMGFPEDELRAQLTGVKLLDLRGNIHAFLSLPEMICLPHAIRTIGERYHERGHLSELPSSESLVEPKYIEKLAYLGGR